MTLTLITVLLKKYLNIKFNWLYPDTFADLDFLGF